MSALVDLVCIAGVSGAGKDVVGSHLEDHHGFERVAFADPIKLAAMALFQLSPRQMWGEKRNDLDMRLGASPRSVFQRFGQACAEIDPEVWIRPFVARVQDARRRRVRVVCTDLRTYVELECARVLGASLWLVTRPGALALHETERTLSEWPESRFDRILKNAGTLEDLRQAASRALGP